MVINYTMDVLAHTHRKNFSDITSKEMHDMTPLKDNATSLISLTLA